MTPRERFRRLMSGQAVDRLPVLALEPSVITAWEHGRTKGVPVLGDTGPRDMTWANYRYPIWRRQEATW